MTFRYGMFSKLWVDMMEAFGLNVTVIDCPWGEVCTPLLSNTFCSYSNGSSGGHRVSAPPSVAGCRLQCIPIPSTIYRREASHGRSLRVRAPPVESHRPRMLSLQGANEQKLLEFLKVGAAPSPSSWLTCSAPLAADASTVCCPSLAVLACLVSDAVLPGAE